MNRSSKDCVSRSNSEGVPKNLGLFIGVVYTYGPEQAFPYPLVAIVEFAFERLFLDPLPLDDTKQRWPACRREQEVTLEKFPEQKAVETRIFVVTEQVIWLVEQIASTVNNEANVF